MKTIYIDHNNDMLYTPKQPNMHATRRKELVYFVYSNNLVKMKVNYSAMVENLKDISILYQNYQNSIHIMINFMSQILRFPEFFCAVANCVLKP